VGSQAGPAPRLRGFLRSHCRGLPRCRTIEIGGGIGNLKRRLTAVVAIDIHLIPHSLDSVLNFGAFAIQI
jgi:hypothetical protein